MKKSIFIIGLIIGVSVTVTSCKKDTKEPVCDSGSAPTYDGEMKAFIDSNCALSGCHNSGSSRGDYTSYAGMASDLSSGKIEDRVLEDQDMPKNSELSQDEINLFQCWADNGFAEN